MDYSPETLYLKKVKNRLGVLDIPIYFKLPKSDVLEPFIVVGTKIYQTCQKQLKLEQLLMILA